MGNFEKIFFGSMFVVLISIIIAVPFIYVSEQKSISDLTQRCESRNGTLLKNTYRVGKTSTNTWVCVKPDIIIEM